MTLQLSFTPVSGLTDTPRQAALNEQLWMRERTLAAEVLASLNNAVPLFCYSCRRTWPSVGLYAIKVDPLNFSAKPTLCAVSWRVLKVTSALQ